jgi:hypothetical protein
MKKNVLYIILAALILSVAGIYLYNQLVPQKTSVEVEVVKPIAGQFDEAALKKFNDPRVSRDFYQNIKPLGQGLGNPERLFGPF